eukprot:CAMPEP_0196158294 /NCGR_PEP_ID=MMETSP0910-20130528/45584_1 /TAXON_ID=49265 /ORGANISM="Thalassiosira rotula, Strain GSO102" /LENGTH=56 /DNA_ID=CAMNT_0041423165 /DNA_START=151 /DNA_END=318 /DNA_ORIENTATION=-
MSPNGVSSLSMSAVEETSSASLSPNENIDTQKKMIAKRVSATPSSLDQCGERLRSG